VRGEAPQAPEGDVFKRQVRSEKKEGRGKKYKAFIFIPSSFIKKRQ
jgi:hypothetical protein